MDNKQFHLVGQSFFNVVICCRTGVAATSTGVKPETCCICIFTKRSCLHEVMVRKISRSLERRRHADQKSAAAAAAAHRSPKLGGGGASKLSAAAAARRDRRRTLS